MATDTRPADGRFPAVNALGPLADANEFHAPLTLHGRGRDLLEDLERMLTIRRAEELIADKVRDGVIACPCHLAIGQEAVAVGVARYLGSTDRVFGAHRSHAHFLAVGGSLRALFAEVLGRDTGASRGMGGSMHLRDAAHGFLGSVPIVGATIPIAVGAGLAARLDARGDLATSFFGDGACEEGAFHESLNLARVLEAPVLFVCENNLFSSHLHISQRQPSNQVARYATAHGIPHATVDGNDVVAIQDALAKPVSAMRRGMGPFFLECVTYRWRGHVGHRDDEDVGVKRRDDLEAWKRRDPIGRLRAALIAGGYATDDDAERLDRHVCATIASAWRQAERDPFPGVEQIEARVYGSGVA